MTLRVAICGNVAQNAYLLAQFLRRLDVGVEADSFDLGGGIAMWLPWWEQVSFDMETGGFYPDHFDWVDFARRSGSPRPPWAKILGVDGAAPWYDTQEAFQQDLARYYAASRSIGLPSEAPAARHAVLRDLLAASRLAPAEHEQCVLDLKDYPSVRAFQQVAKAYDLLVLCGPMAAYGVVLPKDCPYITFEHSTMRHAPLRDEPERRLLTLAYQHADANILTNADCGEAAWCLGLHQRELGRVFIPHPVDETRFAPATTLEDIEERDDQRAKLIAAGGEQSAGTELVFWQPARQAAPSASGGKRNDRVLEAFRRYLDEAEPAGAPKAVLMLSYWGMDVDASAGLIDRLGLRASGRVCWAACASKPRMKMLYRAVDVVLDQFDGSVGSFGTTTVEALASGLPVISHVDAATHEWCLRSGELGALPPVAQAKTTPEIYQQMVRLARAPRLRQAMGMAARRWVEQHHSWRYVAERHLALYELVLAKHRGVGERALEPEPAQEVEREAVAA